ncbi:MAG: zinc ribbon domain-containing protein [Candidatus Binatus sp.]|uniref:FmdB family zinc ribbon protein n=1 Tax=Candidatus Binatus sp. TaxID=2811406 RepID=UPI0027159F05|nr:zinc ribbon domain-containing protein [Candidatus Binatus sp.]MDO8434619.1 zinc ribbon domain-containing protein [Candidatus Binatus sp.]
MPIYEYRCVECDRSFEAFVRGGGDEASCPECHGSHLTREMSTFAARGSNGDGASAAMSAIAGNGASAGRMTGGGCCGGGCGCH